MDDFLAADLGDIELLLRESIQKRRLDHADFVLIQENQDPEVRMHQTLGVLVLPEGDPGKFVISESLVVLVEDIKEGIIDHFQLVQYHNLSFLHVGNDVLAHLVQVLGIIDFLLESGSLYQQGVRDLGIQVLQDFQVVVAYHTHESRVRVSLVVFQELVESEFPHLLRHFFLSLHVFSKMSPHEYVSVLASTEILLD